MKPIIRTITGFISINDFVRLDELLDKLLEVKRNIDEAGYEIQTIRITTDILDQGDPELLFTHENFINRLESDTNVSLYHLGSIDNPDILNHESVDRIVDYFINHKKAFLTVDAANEGKSRQLTLAGADICKKIAAKRPFECRRFAVYAGVTESTPFFPASRVFNNSMKFAIGLQCANLAVEEAKSSEKNRIIFESRLKTRMEKEFSQVDKLIPSELKNSFIGFDTSLAPFPQNEFSIANAIEIVLDKPFGSSGTLSICRLLTRVMKETNIKKTGLCGLMLPVVEDNILGLRGIEGRYTTNDLMLFSSVCATGLDTVPISGETSLQDLADYYHDLATLALKLNKPLSARFFIETDKKPGETIKYDWAFASISPVFKI